MVWSPATEDLSRIDTPKPWSNFAKTVQIQAAHFYTPIRLSDLVAVAYQTSAAGEELHAVGSGHGFEAVAVAADRLVSLDALKSPLSYVIDGGLTDARRAVQDDAVSPRKLFHIQGGVTIAELNEVLAANGLGMITLGGANVQALAGAIATSTHGGDIGLPPLPDVVQAVHLVTAKGGQVWIERASDSVTTDQRLRAVLGVSEPVAEGIRIRRDDDLLNAVVVACGRFGVIYSVVLEVARAYRLAEYSVTRPTSTVLGRLRVGVPAVDAGFGLASLNTVLETPPAEVGAETASGVRYLNISMASAAPTDCWVQRRWATTTTDDKDLSIGASKFCGAGVAAAILLIAAQAIEAEALGLVAVPVIGIVWATELFARANELRARAVAGGLSTGEAMVMATRAAWDSNLGWVVPILNRTVVGERMGSSRRGPSHLVMTGDRASNRDCYTGRSTEVVFPANTTDYLDFLETILPIGPTLRQVGYVSLRFCSPSAAWISMHHLPSRMVVSVEVSSLGGMPDSAAWVAFVERTAVRFGGRPHWGQEHKLTAAEVSRFYGDDLSTWREHLNAVSGSDTTFSNALTRGCGLEPAVVPRAANLARITVDTEVFEPDRFDDLAVDFGDVDVGHDRVVSIELTNGGASLLQVGASVDGDFEPAVLRVDGSLQARTGEYALVVLLFRPTRPGPLTGSLTLTTDAPATPQVRLPLSAAAHGPVMTVDPTALDFGPVQPGVIVQRTIHLRNDGDRTCDLLGASIVDARPGDFSVTPETAEVAAGQGVDLTVSFATTSAGPTGGRLRLHTASSTGRRTTLEVGLAAEQLVAIPELTPVSLTFGAVPLRRVSIWQSVQLTNRGTGRLTLAGLRGSTDFECAGLLPPVLEAGGTSMFLVRFRPRSPGALIGEVEVDSDVVRPAPVVSCSGIGLAVPLLVAETQGVSFGAQPVATTGEARRLRFTNDGGTMHLLSVDITGADAADFAVAPGGAAAIIPPEGVHACDVSFTPTASGALSALLRVVSDAYDAPHLFPLDGVGMAPPPMTVNPTVLTFVPRPVGDRSGALTVTLTNNGSAAMEVASVAVVGAQESDFAILGGDCLPKAVIPVGGTCSAPIVFTPSLVGARAAQLRIAAVSGDVAVVTLKSTGVGADLVFDPPDTDFGTFVVGGLTNLHEVRLVNTGDAPVAINTLGVAADFVSASSCAGNVLGPGGSCTVRLRMRARGVGPVAGRIVAQGAGGLSAVATLHGVGAAPAVGLTPGSVTFADAPIGTLSMPIAITLTNTGTWPLTPHNTQLRGPEAADFTLLATADGAVLQAGETRMILLTFTPRAAGQRTASLEFETNVQAAPHRLPLVGTGQTPIL